MAALEVATVKLILEVLELGLTAGAHFMDAASEINHTILESRKPGGDLTAALTEMKSRNAEDRRKFDEAGSGDGRM